MRNFVFLFGVICVLSFPGKALSTSKPEKSQLPLEETPRPKDQIIFASLSGASPRYIDSGPDRGLGWIEFMTSDIRTGLQKDGFTVKQEWMTPARIEHEFRNGSPICFFPVNWNKPSERFRESSPIDRIYSIALDLEGEDTQSIIFNKSDAWKFKKHIDQKGDLKLGSLLADPSLKTLLVRDQDYGLLTSILTSRRNDGEQIIREPYEKHVELRVIRENQQLVEMLRARRFDYTIADAIEASQVLKSGIHQDDFVRVSYQASRISSIHDENLILKSVSCALHPSTIRAMPYINKWILKSRTQTWIEDRIGYRATLDATFRKTSNTFWNTTAARFMGALFSGEGDRWYALQQKKVPTLLKFPPPHPLQNPITPLVQKAPRTAPWLALELRPQELTVLKESDFWDLHDQRALPGISPYNLYSRTKIGRILNYGIAHTQTGRFPAPIEQNESLPQLKVLKKRWKKLSLFGASVHPEDMDSLVSSLRHSGIEKFALFEAAKPLAKTLLANLPTGLKELTVVLSDLSQIEVGSMDFKNLTDLRLEAGHLSSETLKQIVEKLPPGLKVLSLSHHPKMNRQVAEALREVWTRSGKIAGDSLQSLDLEFCFLGDTAISPLVGQLPKSLKQLHLNGNFISPEATQALFSQGFPELKTVELAGNMLSGETLSAISRLPELEEVDLSSTSLRPEALLKFRPKHLLRTLRIRSNFYSGHNRLDEGSILPLFQFLAPNVDELRIESVPLGAKAIQALRNSNQIKKIRFLEFPSASISDPEVRELAQLPFEVDSLDLSLNQIRNAGAILLGKRFGPHLKGLNLSKNFIGDEGLLGVLENLSPQLTLLKMGSNLRVSVSDLAKHVPSALETLDLSNLFLSDEDLVLLAPRLPKSLVELDLGNSGFDLKGMAALSSASLDHLRSFLMSDSNLQPEAVDALCRLLPPSLASLILSRMTLASFPSGSCPHFLSKSGLKVLKLSRIEDRGNGITQLLGSLPNSLIQFEFSLAKPSIYAIEQLATHWPENLRGFDALSLELGNQGMEILSKGFPDTIETLSLQDTRFTDRGGKALFQNRLSHIYRIILDENQMGDGATQALKKFPRFFRLFSMVACGLTDRFFLSMDREVFKEMKALYVGNNKNTYRGMLHFLKQLGPDTYIVAIASSGLRYQDIPAFFPSLPRNLSHFVVTGTQFGQMGMTELRRLANEREKSTGLPLDLVE